MAVTIDGSANTVTADATLTTKLTTASGSAPSYSARAWVNFNGTGTVAIRASGNVSSITDNGTGNYTINFTNAMPDVNYAFIGSLIGTTASTLYCPRVLESGANPVLQSTTQLTIYNAVTSVSFDVAWMYGAIFR